MLKNAFYIADLYVITKQHLLAVNFILEIKSKYFNLKKNITEKTLD